jgi:hypothetical protein
VLAQIPAIEYVLPVPMEEYEKFILVCITVQIQTRNVVQNFPANVMIILYRDCLQVPVYIFQGNPRVLGFFRLGLGLGYFSENYNTCPDSLGKDPRQCLVGIHRADGKLSQSLSWVWFRYLEYFPWAMDISEVVLGFFSFVGLKKVKLVMGLWGDFGKGG